MNRVRNELSCCTFSPGLLRSGPNHCMTMKTGPIVRRLVALFFATTIFLAVQIWGRAQNIASASLGATVEDTNGASIVGATVTVMQVETNQQRKTNSDHDGRFKFPYLPVGN